MGFVIKRDNAYNFQWREYLLFNPYKGYAFLSEYNGHWNFFYGYIKREKKVTKKKKP